MNKKNMSIIVLIALTLSSISGCNSINTTGNNTNENKPVPYYSVTNAFADHDENFYYDLDVRIPMINYSNEENDELIDSINKEIYNNLTSHIETAKQNAYDTYNKFLKTAIENLKNDREKKIDELKIKYKEVLGPDEVKAIAKILNEEVEIDDNVTATESIIEAFTGTEDLIIPELHNKNIIIVETTKKDEITQATIEIEGKPGKKRMMAPPEQIENKSTHSQIPNSFENKNIENSIPSTNEFENKFNDNQLNQKDIQTEQSNEQQDKNNDEQNNKQSNDKSDSEFKNFPVRDFSKASFSNMPKHQQFKGMPPFENIPRFNRASFSDIDFDEITVENFYRELHRITMMRFPSKRELTRQFTRTHIDCSWDVKCLDNDYLSLLIDISESKVSTASRRYYYNIDLKNKKLLKLQDILGEKYNELCVNAINKEIESWDIEKKYTLNKSSSSIEQFINEDTSFFINNNHSPVVVMDKFAITAGAVGYPEFLITK